MQTKAILAVLAILLLHACMLAWMGLRNAPNVNEMGHLPAGISHWEFGDFELYRVNPPLIRMVAALPAVLSCAKTDWQHLYEREWQGRREWAVGEDFVSANSNQSLQLFAMARWACIPFSVIGGIACFRWACSLYGLPAGYIALCLWSFSPTVLGNAAMITPDIGAASSGVVACFFFWRWLSSPGWTRATVLGLVLGIAQLSKATLLVFYALWPLLFLLWQVGNVPTRKAIDLSWVLCQLLLICASSVCVVNAAYRFVGSGQRLGNYQFNSCALGGSRRKVAQAIQKQNRFSNTFLADLRVPLPSDYVLGIDMQRLNFEQGMWSYLRGTWRLGGWWYYYLYALLIKVPLGTWCLVTLALGITAFGRDYMMSWRDEMMVLAPGLVILAFVSSQTGFSIHSRYAIPSLPFFFIWTSKVARAFELGHRKVAAIVVGALTWSVASSLAIYPHSLSYFNELTAILPTPVDRSYPIAIGKANENRCIFSKLKYTRTMGPRNGPRHLLDSNIDWGQDLFYLKDWLNEHPNVKLDGLAYWGSFPTRLAGIPKTARPLAGPNFAHIDVHDAAAQLGPKPGWYALSVNYVYGRIGEYRYFLRFQPVAMAGYSIYIYHVTLSDANRVRRELGLVGLPGTFEVKSAPNT